MVREQVVLNLTSRALRKYLVAGKSDGALIIRHIALVVTLLWLSPAFAQTVPCKGSDLVNAQAAQSDAQGTLKSVLNFLNGNDSNSVILIKRWFGRSDQATINKVAATLSRTADWISNVSLYCIYSNDGSLVEIINAPNGSIILKDRTGDLFAYVDPGNLTKINLGLAFFNAPATGRDGKLGAIVHEVTHFFLTGNTDDIEYGRDDCLKLAADDPDSAMKNADNYEYFIEDWLSASAR